MTAKYAAVTKVSLGSSRDEIERTVIAAARAERVEPSR